MKRWRPNRVNQFWRLVSVIAVLVGGGSLAFGARFGAWCAEDYANEWMPTLPYSWGRCDAFVSQLGSTDWEVFYYDLVGKKYYFESSGDHQPNNDSADDVDLLFVNTHGLVDQFKPGGMGAANYAMYNQATFATSTSMRLGDSAWWGGGLAILATYSCETLKSDDGLLPTRWGPALSGGLKMIVGGFHNLWASYWTQNAGAAFAQKLQEGEAIEYAWRDAVDVWNETQDMAVVATGANPSDCYARKDQMTWQNFGSYPFIRDNNIGYYCWSWWSQ